MKAKILIVSGYEESGADGIDENVKSLIKGYLTKPCTMEEIVNSSGNINEDKLIKVVQWLLDNDKIHYDAEQKLTWNG